MTIAFDRPVGAPADVKELEYLSALAQTSTTALRADGSLHVEDVVNYLTSRHGIRTPEHVIHQEITTELAGALQSDSTCIDICQVASMLLLPHVKRIASSNNELQIQQFFGKGLQLLLAELPEDSSYYDDDGELILSTNLVRELLALQGEYNVSPLVLEEMVRVAGGDQQIFDADTLMQATTSDLAPYDLNREDCISTHYEDALQAALDNDEEDNDNSQVVDEEIPPIKGNGNAAALNRRFTASSIDMTADTYSSQIWVTLTWVAVVLIFFAFLWGSLQSYYPVECSTNTGFSFTCIFARGITQWLTLFAQLTTLGALFVSMSSMGNSTFNKRSIFTIVGILLGIGSMFFTTIATYFIQIKTTFFDTTHFHLSFRIVYVTILVVGCTIIALQLVQLIRILLPATFIHALKRFFTPGTVRMERRTKLAAAHKVARMVHNALDIHDAPCIQTENVGLTSIETALLKYQAREYQVEPCGGVLWGWKRIINGTVFREEGVWFHARLIASNVTQVFVVLFFAGLWGVVTFDKAFQSDPQSSDASLFPNNNVRHLMLTETASPSSSPTPLPLLPLEFVNAYNLQQEQAKRALYLSAYVGAGAASLACLAIAVIFLPSSISTILKYRTGVLPSLRSKSFLQYRYAQDHAASLIGRAFWGAFFTGGICLYTFGSIAAAFVKSKSRLLVTMGLAQLVGIGITYIVKVSVLTVLRRYFYASFYRKKPAAANILGAMLECWHLGLATGQMLLRTLLLIFVTAFYIGRIDTPLLAPGVAQFGSVVLDGGPFAFQKDILLHEAHRHPYIERLGLLYLTKLRQGDAFATRAGSCWRLLFTLALMPWLRKYRVRSVTASLDGRSVVKSLDWRNPSMSKELVRTDSSDTDSSFDEEDVHELLARVRRLELENRRLKQNLQTLRQDLPKTSACIGSTLVTSGTACQLAQLSIAQGVECSHCAGGYGGMPMQDISDDPSEALALSRIKSW